MFEQDSDMYKKVILSEHDARLIQIIRRMKQGELRIVVAKGMPVMAEKLKRDISI